MTARIALAAATVFIVGACSGDSAPSGESLYSQPHPEGNSFACATCHALTEPAADGLRRPGHSIGDAVNRPSYKNGQLSEMREAVNTCLTEWMTAPAWGSGDARWSALKGYLAEQAPAGSAPALTIQQVAPPSTLTGGDIARGQALFNSSCVVCHGADAVGTQRAPALLGSLLDAPLIAERVRQSGPMDSPTYPGLAGGRMPFWSADRLSDDELRDAIAFVLSNEPAAPGADGGVAPSADAGPSGCGTTHARIGQTAQLSTLAHGVVGTARVVDDCTIAIEMFGYDGNGIDVRIYGGIGGDYTNGFAMTGDLLKPGGYQDETLIARLPAGRTLDDLDGVSVWCVTVGANFGDARFP